MKKIIVVLSLGLIASSMSLHAKGAKAAVMGQVEVIQEELMNAGEFLKGKSVTAKNEAMETLQEVSKVLSKNMLEAVNDAKNAARAIDIKSVAKNLIDSSLDIFKREYKNQEAFDGKKYQFGGFVPTSKYAAYLAQPAIDAARKITNILPYLKEKVPALLRQLAEEAKVRTIDAGKDVLEVGEEAVASTEII